MHVLYFCICTCSAHLSRFHMQRRSRNVLIITILLLEDLTGVQKWQGKNDTYLSVTSHKGVVPTVLSGEGKSHNSQRYIHIETDK